MKHFINIFIVLVLVGLSVGVAYLSENSRIELNFWWLCYIPIIAFMRFWGKKLIKDY